MKKITDLTDQDCLDLYNANSGEDLEAVDIERSPYGLLEIHHVGGYDDMMLTVSEHGAIYLLCLDNNEIYHDCLGALEWLRNNQVAPFYQPFN